MWACVFGALAFSPGRGLRYPLVRLRAKSNRSLQSHIDRLSIPAFGTGGDPLLEGGDTKLGVAPGAGYLVPLVWEGGDIWRITLDLRQHAPHVNLRHLPGPGWRLGRGDSELPKSIGQV